MLIAQITDLHMRRDETPMSGLLKTRPYIATAVDRLIDLAPDLVVVTGDLTDVGSVEEYHWLRAELMRLPMPVRLVPGNHDRRDHLRAVFADHRYLPTSGPLHWVEDQFDVRVIGLDDVLAGHEYGWLNDEDLMWLDHRLAEQARPTVIAVHHPPFKTGLQSMDAINLRNGDALADVVRRHPHVERVICGHHHRPISAAWAGTIVQVAPAVPHQVHLDFNPRDAAQWVMEPPAAMLYFWDGEQLVTHQAYLGDHGPVHEFQLAEDYPGRA